MSKNYIGIDNTAKSVKKYYIGVDNVARKVKKIYVGVDNIARLCYRSQETITDANISEYFTISNNSYYFKGSGTEFTNTNTNVNSSTATTTLTAKKDMNITFKYNYGSEANYDKFTITVNGTTILSSASGVGSEKIYTGTIPAGKTLVFTYSKDGSVSNNGDFAKFYDMIIS